jgi:hypothetical protein
MVAMASRSRIRRLATQLRAAKPEAVRKAASALDAAKGRGTRMNNMIEWLQPIGARSAEAPE